MNLWQNTDNFNREPKKYKTLFLEAHRIDVADDPTPIEAGKAYCRIWLVEMRLAQGVQWFKHRYPVVHAAVRFHHGNHPITIPYLATPGHLRDLGTDNLDRVIQYNYPLTPLFPFNQGVVELQAGLFSMAASNPIDKFLKTIGRFSELLPVPELSSVLKLAEPVCRGIEDLLDMGDRRLELGYQQTFSEANGGGSNVLRAGYFAVILAEEHQLNNDTLCVVNDSLQVGSPGTTKMFIRDCHPLSGYSYMLFRLEKRTAQDWESLTSIQQLVNQAQDGIKAGKYAAVKSLLLPSIKTAIYRSADVAKADRSSMVLKIEDFLQELGLQAAAAPQRSLYTIMQRPVPPVDVATAAELETLEKLFP